MPSSPSRVGPSVSGPASSETAAAGPVPIAAATSTPPAPSAEPRPSSPAGRKEARGGEGGRGKVMERRRKSKGLHKRAEKET